MSLCLIGKQRSFEFRWRRWALLRDTLEALAQPEAVQFRKIGDALVSPIKLDAAALANDVRAIKTALAGKPIDRLAISPKTASVLYMGAKLAEPRPLTPHELQQIAPPRPGDDLGTYFSAMCETILEVCEHPHDDGTVEVLDG